MTFFMYLIGMHITTEPRDQLLYLQDIVMHVKSDESHRRQRGTQRQQRQRGVV